jgi:hypothetical protein
MRISKQKCLKDSEGIITEIHVTYDEAEAEVGVKRNEK